nr:translocation/assembly module TamB [Lacinutrix sp. Hel_I_90]
MENKKDKIPKSKKKVNRILKVIGKIFLSLLLLFIILILFIRSPFGQNIIVNKAISYVSNKTKTKIEIKKLFVTFDGDIQLDGLYLEDKKGDTLIYSKTLEANVPLWSMIKGNGVGVDDLQVQGLRANIIRKDTINGFNFQFLIDAFATKPDTIQTQTAKPLNLIIGQLDFKNIAILYDDAVSGIDSRFDIGKLQLEMDQINLEAMDFKASEIELSNAKIRFFQSPVPRDPNAENIPLPKLSTEKLTLKNVFANYKSQADRITVNVDVADFYAEIPTANLPDNTFEINTLDLRNSVITVYTETEDNAITEKVKEVSEGIKKDIKNFEWPDLRVSIGSINLENDNFSYFVGNAKPSKKQFNPNAIVLKTINLEGHSIFLKEKKGRLNLEALSFNETSGLNLKDLALNFNISDQELKIDGLKLKLNNNALNGTLKLDYNSLKALIEKPENAKIAVDFPSFNLDLNELFKFQPALEQNAYLKKLSKKPLTGHLQASGYLSNVSIPKVLVNWGKTTRISASGTLKNTTDPDNLQFNIPKFSAETIKKDLVTFVDETALGVSLPENIKIAGTVKGNLKNIYTNSKITTSQGIATIAGRFNSENTIAFDATLKVEDYKLSELLKNKTLGEVSLTIKANGKGQTINTLDARAEATISSFNYDTYAIKDLKILGDIKNGKGTITSQYKDENLNLELNTFVILDSIAPEAKVNLNVIGANIKGLGLMQRDVRTGLKLKADFKGNAEKYTFDAQIDDGVVVYDNKTYLLGRIDAKGLVRQDTTSVRFENKLVDLDLQSNTDPKTFGVAIKAHLYSYFYKDEVIQDSINDVQLKLRGHIAQSPLLNEVFLVNVKDLDTIAISVDFKQKERQLSANITAPHINYSGNELDSLAFTLNTTKNDLNFDLSFKALKAGPIAIQKTMISGAQKNNEMALNITAYNDDKKLINVLSQITGSRDELRYHVLQKDLIFNEESWITPENNEIIYTTGKLEFNNFSISNGTQQVRITDKLPNISKAHVALDFNNFRLDDFLSYFNADKTLASGKINGEFVIEDPFKDTGIIADVTISELEILKSKLGTFTLDAKSLGGNSYDFNAKLKEGAIDLDLTGDYLANENGANLDLDLKLNSFKMKALENFSQGLLKETSGSFSGRFKVNGTTASPQYKGQLNFNNAAFNISMFNAAFMLENEDLSIDNKGITLSNFTIRDKNKNSLIVSGALFTKNIFNPKFDLKLNAKNFQFLNATKKDNNFLYGVASFDADANLNGDLQIPKLDANISLSENTDVTYVMPSAAVNVEQRDGVVIFVNRENPDAILTQTEEATATIKGFDIKSFLKVGKKATVTIIIDEETGDYFKVSGHGDFNFTMKPNGRMNLVGTYNVDAGLYELNLYNLVNRKFELAPGSKVSWSGDPFDAKLDVRAIYNLKASASPLMAAQTSGADPAIQSKYRQVLPFYVYLNINGELLQPKISFKLDMPENEQGAIGGQVYGRVQQVNQQEGELNRQVFSLLVLNRFYPEPGSDGSKGGFATVARSNLNDAVSDQLNVFSNKFLEDTGFELDFGLDSYTDYQGDAPQDRTQLNIAAQKRLFDDRLIVRVGSEVDIQGSSSTGEATPLIGNVSLEYLLTENGRYKLKGFRRNEFENVIDGQTIVSGIGLIFTQEFNKFKELWDAVFYNETKEEKSERERLKAQQKQKDKEKIDPENEEINNK